MFHWIVDQKFNSNDREERRSLFRREVVRDVKDDSVVASGNEIRRQWFGNAAVFIGRAAADGLPLTVLFELQLDNNIGTGNTA